MAANMGGDADTIAAITGGLAANYGADVKEHLIICHSARHGK